MLGKLLGWAFLALWLQKRSKVLSKIRAKTTSVMVWEFRGFWVVFGLEMLHFSPVPWLHGPFLKSSD